MQRTFCSNRKLFYFQSLLSLSWSQNERRHHLIHLRVSQARRAKQDINTNYKYNKISILAKNITIYQYLLQRLDFLLSKYMPLHLRIILL